MNSRFVFWLLSLAVMATSACERRPAGSNVAEPDSGTIVDGADLLIYVPPRRDTKSKAPLVVALSPSADAAAMIRAWRPAAARHGWLVAASKTFRNGVDYDVIVKQFQSDLATLRRDYPVDEARIVVSGFSGGGMAAHALSQMLPGSFRAVVANTGMMEEWFMRQDYPAGHLAVLLASPSDFRYAQMQRDRQFLESKGWKVQWLEFPGGHVLAQPQVYEQAAGWLEQQW